MGDGLTIWANLTTAHHRWMAAWLRRRGWVCFYLDEQARRCGPHPAASGQIGCWLALYQQSEHAAALLRHVEGGHP